jgi:transposase
MSLFDVFPPDVAIAQGGWERRAKLGRLHSDGMKIKDIAALLGVSPSRAAQLVSRYKKERHRPAPIERYFNSDKHDLYEMSVYIKRARRRASD